MGKPIIMGRKTWEGSARPLPGRLNIVVTRDRASAPKAPRCSFAGRCDRAGQSPARCMAGADEICVIGGGEIYAQAMPLADRLKVTHVLGEVDGDTLFPPIDPEIWRIVSVEDVPAGEKDSACDAIYGLRATRGSALKPTREARRSLLYIAGRRGGRVESAPAHPYRRATRERALTLSARSRD